MRELVVLGAVMLMAGLALSQPDNKPKKVALLAALIAMTSTASRNGH
jgi:hypothetical protein